MKWIKNALLISASILFLGIALVLGGVAYKVTDEQSKTTFSYDNYQTNDDELNLEVNDANVALGIAKAVLKGKYDDQVIKKQEWVVSFDKDTSIWCVKGSSEEANPFVLINKEDGKILAIGLE